MDKDEIGIVSIYLILFLYIGWFAFSPRDTDPSGDVVLSDAQLFLYTFSLAIVLVSSVVALVLGWSGLSKPRYGKSLVLRQRIVYWAGVMPTISFSVILVVYGLYIFKQEKF